MRRTVTSHMPFLISRSSTSGYGLIMAAVLALLLNGCVGNGAFDTTRKQIGTAIGGVVGGAGGAMVGKQVGGTGGMIAGTVIGAAAGAWVGNRVAAYLDEKDQQKLAEATQTTAVTGEPQTYQNPETGVTVQTRVTQTETRTEPVAVPVLKDRVEQVPPLELIGALYHARSNVNVRGGPGTDYRIVGGLKTGETVTAVGKVVGQEWYMIGEGGAGRGFVAASFLEPTSEAAPAAAPVSPADVETTKVEATRVCRTVEQLVVDDAGKEHTEQVTACKGPNGWEIG